MFHFWRSTLATAQAEFRLVRRFPRLRWIVPGIILIPALYAYIYLDSVWDPASRASALPVALVNLDRGTLIGGRAVSLGTELVQTLQARQTFGFRVMEEAEAAKASVRAGHHVFALIIPSDFSAAALTPAKPGAGTLVVFASEGNNYLGAGFARRFASELGHQVNETLNERRWEAVLGTTASSSDQLERWRLGVTALRDGALELDQGVTALGRGVAQWGQGQARVHEGVVVAADGLRQTAQSVRALEARRPPPSELAALRDGAARLSAGQGELRQGLGRLEEGAGRLVDGMVTWREDVAPIPLIGDQALESTAPLLEGAQALRRGIGLARGASAQLVDGAQALSLGVTQLTDGLAVQAAGAAALSARMPPEERLEEWTSGSRAVVEGLGPVREGLQRLQDGSGRLAAGLDTLRLALPPALEGPKGSAGGLAASVEPRLEIDAPVANNGMGFLPNFVPVALWLGAVMTAFIFHLRRLPVSVQGLPPGALLAGKMTVLGGINLAQAGCVLLMSTMLLGLKPVHATGLALTMACSAVTFMLLILLLVRLLGDVGKAVALVLLIVQLSAAGGLMPVELTSEFYGAISPWLPFTWSVKAVRASAFGAFGHDWGAALGMLTAFAGVFVLLLCLVGRWQFVEEADHRPAMD